MKIKKEFAQGKINFSGELISCWLQLISGGTNEVFVEAKHLGIQAL